MKKVDLLLKNAQYLTADFRVEQGVDIAVIGDSIADITAHGEFEAEQTIDCTDLLLMPGLVDGHLHTSQQLLRGRLLDEKPVIWKRVNVPFESRLDEELSALSAEVAALEMICSGTTGFVDVGGKMPLAFVPVYQQSGLRGRLTYLTNDSQFTPEALRTNVEESLRRLPELHSVLGGKLQGYHSIATLNAASLELIEALFAQAKELDRPMTIHMNEYSSEVFDFIERYGKRPFEFLYDNKLLDVKMVASHCIYLSQQEQEILQEKDVVAIHCPFSNCGKGVPATPALIAKGIKVGLGTDGAGHGGLDMFKEIRLFRGVMNISHGLSSADPQIMPAKTLLGLATAGSASALFEENLGSIAVGNKADIIAIDQLQPHLFPTQNIVNTLVESADGHDVVHSIVGGQVLMKNRQVLTLDAEKIRFNVKQFLKKHPEMAFWK